TTTSAAFSTQLGSCTIPGGLLTTGDRIGIEFHYGHTGTATAFTAEILWGTASVLLRSSVLAETALAGHMSFAISAGGQTFDAQSWGASFAPANTVGSVTGDTTQNLTISLRGQMAGTTTDSLTLRNFTVVRYPAQANP